MKKIKRTKINQAIKSLFQGSLISLTLLIGSSRFVNGQSKPFAFSPGEEISYGAYYNWHFIWVNAGEVVFNCDTIRRKQQTEWVLKATGHTYRAYDLMYTVRDTFETRLSYPAFQPLHFYRTVNHGGSSSEQSYDFQAVQGKIDYFYQSNKAKSVRSSIAYQPGIYDLLSQAYLFRNFKFETLKKGETVKFKMLADDDVSEFYFRYQGIDQVKTRNGRKFNCHRISVWLMEGEFFPEGEDMTVWFTADKNHIPIMVETKIQIGSVKAIFLDANSLTYPLKSEIN